MAISCDGCCIRPVKWGVDTQRSELDLRISHHSVQKSWLQEGTKVGSDSVEGALLQRLEDRVELLSSSQLCWVF